MLCLRRIVFRFVVIVRVSMSPVVSHDDSCDDSFSFTFLQGGSTTSHADNEMKMNHPMDHQYRYEV